MEVNLPFTYNRNPILNNLDNNNQNNITRTKHQMATMNQNFIINQNIPSLGKRDFEQQNFVQTNLPVNKELKIYNNENIYYQKNNQANNLIQEPKITTTFLNCQDNDS